MKRICSPNCSGHLCSILGGGARQRCKQGGRGGHAEPFSPLLCPDPTLPRVMEKLREAAEPTHLGEAPRGSQGKERIRTGGTCSCPTQDFPDFCGFLWIFMALSLLPLVLTHSSLLGVSWPTHPPGTRAGAAVLHKGDKKPRVRRRLGRSLGWCRTAQQDPHKGKQGKKPHKLQGTGFSC